MSSDISTPVQQTRNLNDIPSFDMIKTPIPKRFNIDQPKRAYTYHSRERCCINSVSNRKIKRMQNANRLENPFDVVRTCCKRQNCFSKINTVRAFRWYRDLMEMEREDVKGTLLSWYNVNRRNFEFDGIVVCWRFLNKAFGFSNDLISAVRHTPCSRAAQTAFAKPRKHRPPTLRDSIINFLHITAMEIGDDMPHRTFTNLPLYNRKKVYEQYISWFSDHDPLRFSCSPPVISTFYSVWKRYVPEVRVLRNIGFQKCAECVFYEEEREKNLLNHTRLRQIRDASKKHYEDMARERRGYHLRKF